MGQVGKVGLSLSIGIHAFFGRGVLVDFYCCSQDYRRTFCSYICERQLRGPLSYAFCSIVYCYDEMVLRHGAFIVSYSVATAVGSEAVYTAICLPIVSGV